MLPFSFLLYSCPRSPGVTIMDPAASRGAKLLQTLGITPPKGGSKLPWRTFQNLCFKWVGNLSVWESNKLVVFAVFRDSRDSTNRTIKAARSFCSLREEHVRLLKGQLVVWFCCFLTPCFVPLSFIPKFASIAGTTTSTDAKCAAWLWRTEAAKPSVS